MSLFHYSFVVCNKTRATERGALHSHVFLSAFLRRTTSPASATLLRDLPFAGKIQIMRSLMKFEVYNQEVNSRDCSQRMRDSGFRRFCRHCPGGCARSADRPRGGCRDNRSRDISVVCRHTRVVEGQSRQSRPHRRTRVLSL